MSILTSDESNKLIQLIKSLIRLNVILSILSYLASLALFVYLIHEPMKTSFHDNSLLPGLANREFVDDKSSEKFLKELQDASGEFSEKYFPVHLLKMMFEKIGGLEVYEHRFRFRYPFGYQMNRTVEGSNLYAVLRAARAASTESIVISTPYRSQKNIHGSTLPSIALMLSLAKFFKKQNYWAKDIVFLISGNELLGIQAWLQSYQGPSNLKTENNDANYLDSDVLMSKAGVIQSALNLELKSFTPQYIQIKIEGLNGQLPNLDLFNVAVELCNRESVPVVFQGESFYMSENVYENWIRKARTMSSMMVTQATMLPTGAHGLFQKYAISSITLEAPDQRPKYIMVNSLNLGRSIEGIVRSLNNMLEKFNRSFYFYLLASTRRFISISLYMIVFGLMALPLAFRSLHYFFKAQPQKSTIESSPIASTSIDVWSSFKPCFLAHLWGILALSIVPLVLTRLDRLSWISNITTFPVEHLSYSIFITLSIISMNPFAWLQITRPASIYSIQSMVALLNALLVLTSISLVNISLALALTSVYVPLLTIVSVQDHGERSPPMMIIKIIRSIFKWSALLLVHPLTLHLICLFILSIWSDPEMEQFLKLKSLSFELVQLLWKHFGRALNGQPRTIMNYIEDWYLFDNWAFPMITLFVYPVWLQLWFQSITRVK